MHCLNKQLLQNGISVKPRVGTQDMWVRENVVYSKHLSKIAIIGINYGIILGIRVGRAVNVTGNISANLIPSFPAEKMSIIKRGRGIYLGWRALMW